MPSDATPRTANEALAVAMLAPLGIDVALVPVETEMARQVLAALIASGWQIVRTVAAAPDPVASPPEAVMLLRAVRDADVIFAKGEWPLSQRITAFLDEVEGAVATPAPLDRCADCGELEGNRLHHESRLVSYHRFRLEGQPVAEDRESDPRGRSWG